MWYTKKIILYSFGATNNHIGGQIQLCWLLPLASRPGHFPSMEIDETTALWSRLLAKNRCLNWAHPGTRCCMYARWWRWRWKAEGWYCFVVERISLLGTCCGCRCYHICSIACKLIVELVNRNRKQILFLSIEKRNKSKPYILAMCSKLSTVSYYKIYMDLEI
jgi:hypothetical protein